MRRYQSRRPTPTSIFASKRIAVALCAAIAMFLGAMSVGATIQLGVPHDGAISPAPGQSSALITDKTRAITPEATVVLPNNAYSDRQSLMPAVVQNSPPLLINPAKPQIDVSFGPLNTLVRDDSIQLKIDPPVLTPSIVSVDTPVMGETLQPQTDDDTIENTTVSAPPIDQTEEEQQPQEPPQTNP